MRRAIAFILVSNLLSAGNFCLPVCGADNGQTALKDEANRSFWQHNFEEAKKPLLKLCDGTLSPAEEARIRVNLAICDDQLDDLTQARKEALQAAKLAPGGSMIESDALSIAAHCYARDEHTDKAADLYDTALSIAEKNLGPWNCDLAPLYEGKGACAFSQGQWAEAKKAYLRSAQLDALKYGFDGTQVAWSLLNLTAALLKMNQQSEADKLYKKVFWNFRHQNEERIISEAQEPVDDEFRQNLIKQLYGQNNAYADRTIAGDLLRNGIPEDVMTYPASRAHDFDNWFKERIGREQAPGLAFFDPRVPLKGLIVAVHGLGLSHNAYTPFAQHIQHQGWGVVAFDVRGFGTYRNDLLYQRVSLNDVIGDLTRILTALRRDYPDYPLVILGESMGGAIALRMGSVTPHLLDAVVSSVPSGSRFHGRSTAISVAVKLLRNRHEQFDIGSRIVKQATNKPDLRESWQDDPSFRMKLSAEELLNFQKFMDENLQYATKIERLPVIIFQGYSDQLVKPLSTLTLYQAIRSHDKDLLFVGSAEHLIFEEAQFDQDVVDGLSGWLDKHALRNRSAEKSPSKKRTKEKARE